VLTTLKDIFRPTFVRVVWTVAIGGLLTGVGFLLLLASVAGPPIYGEVASVFVLGYAVANWLHLRGASALFAFFAFQSLYMYVLVLLATHLVKRVFRIADRGGVR
jgi:hypothetical protein